MLSGQLFHRLARRLITDIRKTHIILDRIILISAPMRDKKSDLSLRKQWIAMLQLFTAHPQMITTITF